MGKVVASVVRFIGRRIVGIVRRVDDKWDEVGRGLAERFHVRNAVMASVGVLYLIVNVARTTLDAGVKKVHAVGVDGVSTNSLHDGKSAITKAIATWDAGNERLKDLLSLHPISMARIQTLLELLLVPLTFFVWYGAGKALRHRVARIERSERAEAGESSTTPARHTPIMTVLYASAFGVLAYVVLGVVNQLIELYLLYQHDPVNAALAQLLRGTGFVRGLLLPLFLVPLVVAMVELERRKPSAERLQWWRGSGTTYRVLIVAAIVHAGLLLFSIAGAQTADALRLWVGNRWLGVWGIVFTGLFSLGLASIALRLGTDAGPKRVVLGRAGTKRTLLFGLALLAIGFLARGGLAGSDGKHPWNAGVIGAGVLITLVAALSMPLSRANDDTPGVRSPGAAAGHDGVVEPGREAKQLVPSILAAAPLAALSVALVKAALPSVLDHSKDVGLLPFVFIAAALSVAGFCLGSWYADWAFSDGQLRPHVRRVLFIGIVTALGVGCVIVYAAVIRNPFTWAPRLGVPALIAVFLTAVIVVFGTAGYLMESRPLPAALDFVGFRRLPVIFGLLAWSFFSNRFDTVGYHDITTMKDQTVPPGAQMSAASAFGKWLAANGLTVTNDSAPATTAEQARTAVPMVFVAAAGGGIKAAAFTAATLDCLLIGSGARTPGGDTTAPLPDCTSADDAYSKVFALSGASGGSVGIASFVATMRAANGDAAQVNGGWVKDYLGRDLLTPELGWQLMVEVPNSIVGFNPGLDRGEVLQESWRRSLSKVDVKGDGARRDTADGGRPFYVDQTGPWTEPVMFLSGTNLEDGCRVNISSIRASGPDGERTKDGVSRSGSCTDRRSSGSAASHAGTRDLLDHLCSKDPTTASQPNIDLATAAFLSARFPIVSPTGTVTCDVTTITTRQNDGVIETDSTTETFEMSIGDGGYRDNSGASSIMDTWGVLEPLVQEYNRTSSTCIAPIFVEINNGYAGLGAEQANTGTAAQLLAPVLGATKVFGDLSYGQIEQAAAEFSRPLDETYSIRGSSSDGRFFRISLIDHPGVTAPLGWSLSQEAVDDVVTQLRNDENATAVTQVRDILSGANQLQCVPSP